MKNEEIIQVLESCLDRAKDLRRYYRERADFLENFVERMAIVDHEIQALSEAVETFNLLFDDEPLTLDQLRTLIGSPVWIEVPELGWASWAILNTVGDTGFFITTTEFSNKYIAYSLYDATCRVYAGFHSPVKRWICVQEQMPDAGERVLVCCGTFVCEAYCDINGYFHRIPQERWPGEDAPHPITHWMPLPDAPVSAWLEDNAHA